ncbi:hypothetical protein G4P69_26175 [Aetokthonos hydrillicola CCALA 1050]|nr:hypothetical protein [Aetokthonos hydrillicola CCALA 1050]
MEKHKVDSATFKTVQYVYDRKGANLDAVAQQCLDDNITLSNITRVVNATQSSIFSLIKEEDVEDLSARSKQELVKISDERNIPLTTREKRDTRYSGLDSFSNSSLKLDGLDEYNKIRESLRWINCLCEFYTGESLLNESGSTIPHTQEQPSHIMPESDPLYESWLAGYLQCDLSR